MPWYNSINEARQKAGDVTGIRKPSDLASPGGRTEDLFRSAAKGVIGSDGGMDTDGRGQVDPITNEFGEPWDFSKDADPNQRSPQQAAAQDEAERVGELKYERDVSRGQQMLNIRRLQTQARGEGGPSAAQGQLQLATDNNMRQALAMAASGRGNAALAGQAAGQQRAQMGQQLASQSSALRAQEMQSAQQQLTGALTTKRGQDMGDQQRELQYKQLEQQKQMQYDQIQSNQRIAKGAGGSDLDAGLNFISTGLAAYAAFSDERVKKNKSNVPDAEVDEFYKALQAKNYEYKDPDTPGQSPGEKIGLMAQDVEGTKLGDKLFSDGPGGMKQYDPQVLDGILLAGMKKLMKDQNYGNS